MRYGRDHAVLGDDRSDQIGRSYIEGRVKGVRPGGQPASLERGPGFGGQHLLHHPPRVRDLNDAERGPDLYAGERSGVAVSQNPKTMPVGRPQRLHPCGSPFGHGPIRVDVRLEDSYRPLDYAISPRAEGAKSLVDPPTQVDRRRTSRCELDGGSVGRDPDVSPVLLCPAHSQRDAERAGHPQGWSTPHAERLDCLGQLRHVTQPQQALLMRQARLVDDYDRFVIPVDGPVHALRLVWRQPPRTGDSTRPEIDVANHLYRLEED